MCAKVPHLPFLGPRAIHLPHHPMVFPPTPPFVALLGSPISSLVCLILLLLLPICALQGTLLTVQQAVLRSQPTPPPPWEAQLSLMADSGCGPEVLMGGSCEPRGRWARLQLGADERAAALPPGGQLHIAGCRQNYGCNCKAGERGGRFVLGRQVQTAGSPAGEPAWRCAAGSGTGAAGGGDEGPAPPWGHTGAVRSGRSAGSRGSAGCVGTGPGQSRRLGAGR